MEIKSRKFKVTELPLYESCCCEKEISKSPPDNVLTTYITYSRESVEEIVNPILGDYPKQIKDSLKSTKTFVDESLQYVKNDNNQAARATFITSSAFIGYLLGRRGLIRRSLFGLAGAGLAFSFCNPKLAKDYADVSMIIAKRKTTELYDAYGNQSLDFIKNIQWNVFSDKSKDK